LFEFVLLSFDVEFLNLLTEQEAASAAGGSAAEHAGWHHGTVPAVHDFKTLLKHSPGRSASIIYIEQDVEVDDSTGYLHADEINMTT
jgi:hypothetical protein